MSFGSFHNLESKVLFAHSLFYLILQLTLKMHLKCSSKQDKKYIYMSRLLIIGVEVPLTSVLNYNMSGYHLAYIAIHRQQ